MAINFYVIDTETNGLKDNYHEINQISIVRCSDRVQLSRTIKAEHPERSTPKALEVTNRKMSDLLVGDSKEDAVQACNEFFNQDGGAPEERCIIGHNIISFDKRFLHALWESCNKSFPANLWLDTMTYMSAYAKHVGLEKKKFNLEAAMIQIGLTPKPGAHTAKGDSRNNYLLWDGLKKTGVSQVQLIKRFSHMVETDDE